MLYVSWRNFPLKNIYNGKKIGIVRTDGTTTPVDLSSAYLQNLMNQQSGVSLIDLVNYVHNYKFIIPSDDDNIGNKILYTKIQYIS